MTPRTLPDEPVFRSSAEEQVWRALRSGLCDDDVLLAGLRFTGEHDGDWEVDLVVLMPDAGVATIEVKGGQVWYEDGQWHQRTAEGDKTIDLVEQAVSEKYLVHRYLQRHPRWSRPPMRMVHLVALPGTPLAADADLGPGLPRSRVIARGELGHAARRLRELLAGPLDNQPSAAPGHDAVDLAADLLAGRGDPQADLARLRQEREDHVARLTQGQQLVLSLAQAIPRYQVVGGPGSGKTWLAMEQARRWAGEGLRVGFVAYSLGLTTWVHRAVAAWPKPLRRKVKVSTFHGLGHAWGAVAGDGADQVEWEVEVPRRMAALAAGLPDEARFDALVVDESQDLASLWWPALLGSLRDPDAGRLAVFGDAAQRVFAREGGHDLDLPVLTLEENLRNSGPIGNAVNALLPATMALRGGAGPDVRFVPCSADQAIGCADEQAVALLEAGWPACEVALLTTAHRHPVQVEGVAYDGRDGYWQRFWDDGDLFYATVAGFKGLERPAVVLAVDGFLDPATARQVLAVGLSRARDQLVVCADPAMLLEVAGPECARRIGAC